MARPVYSKEQLAQRARVAQDFEHELKLKEIEAAKRRELWNALNHFVRSNNRGWIVSPPSDVSMRIECPPDSELPDLLVDRGFELQALGSNTRIEGGRFLPVHVYALRLLPLKK